MNLITQPEIFPIGQTTFRVADFDEWMEFNGHEDLDLDTPLKKLWLGITDEMALERMIEFGGRHCYRAWERGRDLSDYVRNIIEMGHGSVLEHSTINWAVQGVSRSLSLELARHRVGIALSQESQRYVDAGDINMVVPPLVLWTANKMSSPSSFLQHFEKSLEPSLALYREMQEFLFEQTKNNMPKTASATMLKKRANEAARAYLPNATETRFLWTTNMRILRHFIWLRGGSAADLEIRRLAINLYDVASEIAPDIFADMAIGTGDFGVPIIVSADA